MKVSPLFLAFVALSVSSANAGWFGAEDPSPTNVPEYATWKHAQLVQWLHDNGIEAPASYTDNQLTDLVKSNWDASASWTSDRVEQAQHVFSNLKEASFDAWDESALRNFLVEHGVVAPNGPREHLVLLAKQQYRAYTKAASSLSAQASAGMSTAVYGDSKYQASKSASSLYTHASNTASAAAVQSSEAVTRALQDATDYVYSTWTENQLRSYLEGKGVIKSKQQATRDELLAKMRDAYAATTTPVWKAWSDSYIHQWLVDRGYIKSDFQKQRDSLLEYMQSYYYDINDKVYSTWSDAELKKWLTEHDIIKDAKESAGLKRDKLLRMVQDNYANAQTTTWEAWRDNEMREWLSEHGYLPPATQSEHAKIKRDELIQLMNAKYHDYSCRSAPYLSWPDARLRAYLRDHASPATQSRISHSTSRADLLHDVRLQWPHTPNTRLESVLYAIKDKLSSGAEVAEEKVAAVLEMLTGYHSATRAERAKRDLEWAKEKVEEKAGRAWNEPGKVAKEIKDEL
ncbi:hypothetical protein BOTBODRAFT_163031 [Botryobasidium botryosum FD-172 SS1]|uniref:Uncharacterized protein n=1 Tax=Botryobasidium botryosum (strain FD-172 SS1) TaxID=930990 RepID=A0A067M977_BOTB1|nr:hypothetical protein BOTBODRAFT_163031 [Botryobasidium botryosum FD-172 SS1]